MLHETVVQVVELLVFLCCYASDQSLNCFDSRCLWTSEWRRHLCSERCIWCWVCVLCVWVIAVWLQTLQKEEVIATSPRFISSRRVCWCAIGFLASSDVISGGMHVRLHSNLWEARLKYCRVASQRFLVCLWVCDWFAVVWRFASLSQINLQIWE